MGNCKNVLNVARISNIRKQILPDILCWIVFYGFAIVFGTWFCVYDGGGTNDIFLGRFLYYNKFTLSVSLIHILLLLSVGIAVFFVKPSFSHIILKISLSLCASLMLACLLFEKLRFNIFISVALGIMLGLSATALFTRFSAIFNNTERFFSVIFGNVFMVLVAGFSLIYERSSKEFLIFCSVCAFICACLSFIIKFNSNSEEQQNFVPKTLYIIILFAIIGAFVCTGTGILIMQKNVSIYSISKYVFYFGCLCGCAAFYLIYRFFDKALHFSLNATYGATILGVISFLVGGYSYLIYGLSAFFIGASFSLGMLVVYYTAGLIVNKFHDNRYMKLFLLAVGVAGGIGGIVLTKILSNTLLFAISMFAILIAVFVIVFLLIMSPVISKKLFEEAWSKDAVYKEVNIKEDTRFLSYNFTKRETEVANLLLAGDTLRQISIKLKIGYSTVNTYCTSIYRKCNVNSRTELFVLFNK